MSDITKCEGTNCPLNETCYRFTSTANEYYQAMFINPPFKEDGTCESYWEVQKKLKNK